jgi:serine/threonine protein kinase
MPKKSGMPTGWKEYTLNGRLFYHALVPKGDNKGKHFNIAKCLAERYEVTEFFASGGCGLLVRGTDSHTGAGVLIKSILNYDIVLYAQGRDATGMKERIQLDRWQLQTERRIMVQIKNRGCDAIPNPNDYVFDVNTKLAEPFDLKDGTQWMFPDEEVIESEPYLIMEEINGRPLSELLNNQPMDERRALQIMHEVCNVLAIAHKPFTIGPREWCIVYQDLKPANIMIGDHDFVSLLDWGGCRLTFSDSQKPGMLGASTPAYCPPEVDDHSSLTPAADSYTVGSTLFHMLSGHHPGTLIKASSLVSTRKSLRTEEWDFELLNGKASIPTIKFIRDCLDASPRNRPAHGEELARAIAAIAR